MQGLRAAWLHESSFRLEVYLFVVLAPVGWWAGQTPVERVLLVGSMLLVLSIELLNSAVEAVIERYGPEYPRAGRSRQGHGLGGGVRADDERIADVGRDPAAPDLTGPVKDAIRARPGRC